MASYYTKIDGTLHPGLTARSDDINLIQSSISEAIREVVIDICGDGFIIGESENAFKLYATDLHTDQSNLNYNQDIYWVSFYDRYFRQPIEIQKSSIDSIYVDMINDTNITTVVYAEIRDSDFELVKEANAVLPPTPDDTFKEIEFHFGEHHLPLGLYYFVIRPVDISAADLAANDDEVVYTTSAERLSAMPIQYKQTTIHDTIIPEHFCVRYDADGHYIHGFEASYDGSIYLPAQLLDETLVENEDPEDINNIQPCLYFKEDFSKGSTYLVNDECTAVIQGEKVNPTDTHITIDKPDYTGNRIDIVSLNKEGEFIVTKGITYTDNEEKQFPVSPPGNLDIAYITNFPAYINKVPAIDQNDENHLTRQRDILERLRRLEKRIDYQEKNNTPVRIIYNLTVDPILTNDTKDEDATIRGEGTFNIGTITDKNGNTVASSAAVKNYAWSIIENNYTYNIETETTENGRITVWDTYTSSKKDSHYTTTTNGLYHYHAEVTDHSTSTKKAVKGLKVRVQIKKGGTLKHDKEYTTNSKGIINFSTFGLKLTQGTYYVYTIYGNKRIKSKLIVNDANNLKTKFNEKTTYMTISLPKVSGDSVTHTLPEGVFAGDDSFEKHNINFDTKKGEVTIRKISDSIDNYEVNEGRKLLKDQKYTSVERTYTIKNAKSTSTFPAINVIFDREVYIKSITPYISGFKNIDSFGILIFKNDVIKKNVSSRTEQKSNNKKTYNKKIGSGKVDKNNYDDENFPTLYKSKYMSLKDLVKKSGSYKVLKKQITFDDINLDLDAGTYTIMICPKLSNPSKNGEIKIIQYKTKKDASTYGMNTNIYGSSKLAKVRFDNLHVYDESWDVAIKHKTYKYYDRGVLISKRINTGVSFIACNIVKNFQIPNNCEMKLFVSNNGGSSWYEAKDNHVNFKTGNSTFQWKLEMIGNSISTPKLKFNKTRQNAISFSLATTASYVEYEDYGRCFETPLINANHVTRGQTRSTTTNTFTSWEFARVFMEDSELNSKIDILISYADDDYDTNQSTNKDKWNKQIFFSTVFADLNLNDDFIQESIDYDNYDGNVEYDEYNYRFNLKSDELVHYTGGLALASPSDASLEPDIGIYYGNINSSEKTAMEDFFSYDYIDSSVSPYTYYDNDDDDITKQYAGMHISNGPYLRAKYHKQEGVTGNYTSDDVIIGVRFNNGLDINENITHLVIGLMPHAIEKDGNIETITNDITDSNGGAQASEEKQVTFFPPGTFKVAVSLGRNGEIDSQSYSYEIDYATVDEETQMLIDTWKKNENIVIKNSGIEYIIDEPLYSDTYTEISVDFIDDFAGFDVSGINSIAIKSVDPDKNPMSEEGNDHDSIGIGRIITSSYNMRPYVPYMYTGSYNRLQWENIIHDDEDKERAAAYAMYNLGMNKKTKKSSGSKIFYPIDNNADINNKNTKKRKITSHTETIDGEPLLSEKVFTNQGDHESVLQVWYSNKTSRRKSTNRALFSKTNYIERNGSQITTKINGNTYVTKDSGDKTLFHLPGGVTGNLFKINTNIPYTIYNLIDIEYYMFTRYWKPGDTGYSAISQNVDTAGYYNIHKRADNNIFMTDGSFSKGEIYIDFYDSRDIVNNEPIESFALPSWGRIATRSEVDNKIVHAWFKKRSTNTKVRSIVLRRENPRKLDKSKIRPIKLMLNNIMFINADEQAALGPQMQLRIYPNNTDNMTNTKIRKIGGVYRI